MVGACLAGHEVVQAVPNSGKKERNKMKNKRKKRGWTNEKNMSSKTPRRSLALRILRPEALGDEQYQDLNTTIETRAMII